MLNCTNTGIVLFLANSKSSEIQIGKTPPATIILNPNEGDNCKLVKKPSQCLTLIKRIS